MTIDIEPFYEGENEYKLYALDISNPLQPADLGRFELPGNVTKMVAAGDTMYMRLSDGGIWALNISNRSHPYWAGHVRLPISDFSVDGPCFGIMFGSPRMALVVLAGLLVYGGVFQGL